MFRSRFIPMWLGIIALSGMFLMGQESWEPQQKIVFVTEGAFDGDLGGLAGADAICQAEVTAAGLPGVFKAWLSDSVEGPDTRFVQATVPYTLVDGTQVAANWADLTDGEIDNPINLTAEGVDAESSYVWTNTDTTGQVAATGPDSTCADFTSNSMENDAIPGVTSRADNWWTEVTQLPAGCHVALKLYCFQQ